MILLQTIDPIWHGRTVVVAATGPSLTPEVANAVRGLPCIAVSDAHLLLPNADILYSADAPWWKAQNGAREFLGDRWTSHGTQRHNNKEEMAARYGIKVVRGTAGDTFSFKPDLIHYGGNSGFQAINLALLFGATRIILVGFNMKTVGGTRINGKVVGGKRHFFGDHPECLNNSSDFENFVPIFRIAAKALPKGIEIINCTPDSALDCFPQKPLAEALSKELVAA